MPLSIRSVALSLLKLNERPLVTEILVRDTGSGISVNDFSRIFAPFERYHHDSKGAGLGLTICKNLADLHGYSIKVDSKLSLGSTFTLSIPRLSIEKVSAPILELPMQTITHTLAAAVLHSHSPTSRNIIRCLETYGIETFRCDSLSNLFDQLGKQRVSELVIEEKFATPIALLQLKEFISRDSDAQIIILTSVSTTGSSDDRIKYIYCPNSFEQVAAAILHKGEEHPVKKLA